MSYFSIFAILYMSTFLYEMLEKWKHVGFTWAFSILICALVIAGVDRLKFLIFLVASTAYILVFRFPEVANHVNLILVINIPLIAGTLSSLLRPRATDRGYFEATLPFLRLSLVFAYFFAGFHKLNRDFFHPDVSCLGWFMGAFKRLMIGSSVLAIPSAIILMLGMTILWAKLLRQPLASLPKAVKLSLLALATLLAAISGSILMMTQQGTVPPGLKATVIFLVASTVIIWEIAGAVLLAIPGLQGPVLAFSAAMHASFALIGFVDFSSLAFALLLCFVPRNYLDVLEKESHVKVLGQRIHRVHLYFLTVVLNGILTGLHYRIGLGLGDMMFLHGIIFNVGAFILAWPLLAALFSSQPLPWQGVPLLSKQANRFAVLAFASLVLFFGTNSYLGLRTAGNFSMFSNLRTEGESSNHFLLGGNPLKIWSYQEDVVRVLEIDDAAAEIGHKYRPLRGSILPRVEFEKTIRKWTEAGYTVPIEFVYDGVTYASDNIVSDPVWRTPRRTWEMYLMDFRLIQAGGPNECRW